ncbi:response regulator [Candidatus Poribacteria bacterium]|nr:response regulator [Candidatus Poribacteria bacterium]
MNNPPKVLIIENKSKNLSSLGQFLQKDGHDVIKTDNDQDCCGKILSYKPDLILMDIEEKGGIFQKLKDNNMDLNIPIIFITNGSQKNHDIPETEDFDIDYINKPLQYDKVINRIRTHLKLKAMEEEKLEHHQELINSQWNSSIVTMTGDIAHSINNLIGTVIGYTDMLDSKLEGNEDLRRYSSRIIEASQRIADLTKNLHTYSRVGIIRDKFDIVELVYRMLHLYNNEKSGKIEIKLNIPDDIPDITADPNQISQALTNLFINSCEAIKDNGTIEISIYLDKLPQEYIGNPESTDMDFLVVSISDDGKGMEKELIDKIFDPFFTTKNDGNAGLGLSAVSRIIRKHNGAIKVESEAAKGSTFCLYLPVNEASDDF